MKWRPIVMAMLAVLAALAVAACGGDDDDEAANGEGTATEQAADAEPRDVGMLVLLGAAEVTTRGRGAMEAAAEELNWDLTVNDPQGDPQRAVSGLRNLVTQQPDAIFVAPWEATVLRQPLRQAEQNEIPVAAVWGEVGSDEGYSGVYATQDREFARASVEQLREAVPEGGKVAMFTSSGFFFGQARDEVFEQEIGGDEDFEIVATHDTDYTNPQADTERAMRDILNANPDIDAVWADSSLQIPPIANVLRDRDRCGEVAVIGFYGDLPNLQAVRDGCVTAIMETSIEAQSWAAMDVMAGHLNADQPLPESFPGGYPFDPAEILVVTEDNVPQDEQEYVTIDHDYEQYFRDKWSRGEFGPPTG